MFNIFKNSNEGKRDNCYLFKSGVFEQKILEDDKIENYNELLQNKEISTFYKDLIKYFLIPYKISLLKFALNKEYYEDPFPTDFRHDHKHIAPSLKKIKENPFDIPMGYPSWFYIAFPDVALWVMKGVGYDIIKGKYKNLSEVELLDEDNHIRANLLNTIIKLYLSNTNKTLECRKY